MTAISAALKQKACGCGNECSRSVSVWCGVVKGEAGRQLPHVPPMVLLDLPRPNGGRSALAWVTSRTGFTPVAFSRQEGITISV